MCSQSGDDLEPRPTYHCWGIRGGTKGRHPGFDKHGARHDSYSKTLAFDRHVPFPKETLYSAQTRERPLVMARSFLGAWGSWGYEDYDDVIAGVDHALATYPIDLSQRGSASHGPRRSYDWICGSPRYCNPGAERIRGACGGHSEPQRLTVARGGDAGFQLENFPAGADLCRSDCWGQDPRGPLEDGGEKPSLPRDGKPTRVVAQPLVSSESAIPSFRRVKEVQS